jgi:hypothetical protein
MRKSDQVTLPTARGHPTFRGFIGARRRYPRAARIAARWGAQRSAVTSGARVAPEKNHFSKGKESFFKYARTM